MENNEILKKKKKPESRHCNITCVNAVAASENTVTRFGKSHYMGFVTNVTKENVQNVKKIMFIYGWDSFIVHLIVPAKATAKKKSAKMLAKGLIGADANIHPTNSQTRQHNQSHFIWSQYIFVQRN